MAKSKRLFNIVKLIPRRKFCCQFLFSPFHETFEVLRCLGHAAVHIALQFAFWIIWTKQIRKVMGSRWKQFPQNTLFYNPFKSGFSWNFNCIVCLFAAFVSCFSSCINLSSLLLITGLTGFFLEVEIPRKIVKYVKKVKIVNIVKNCKYV